jgi:ABC-type multidrug transport system ATPase subunit
VSLLELERVNKDYQHGLRTRVALKDVSLEIEPGELVVVWGERRSGRSTLLRVAAGVEAPDRGVVRFGGRDLSNPAGNALGGGIGYCRKKFRSGEDQRVLEQMVLAQLARGMPRPVAQSRAWEALERVGGREYSGLALHELDGAEASLVAIARALTGAPRMLVADEPTKGVDVLARDKILLLLRSLADEGIAVLASTGEGTGLSGADRPLSVDEGKLEGALAPAELAPVSQLSRPARLQAS